PVVAAAFWAVEHLEISWPTQWEDSPQSSVPAPKTGAIHELPRGSVQKTFETTVPRARNEEILSTSPVSKARAVQFPFDVSKNGIYSSRGGRHRPYWQRDHPPPEDDSNIVRPADQASSVR